MSPSAQALARRVDDQIFLGPYILIDGDNRSVGSVLTRSQADDALKRDAARTFAARLREEIVAVDIDLPDRCRGLATYIVEELTDWAHRRRLACMSRASGGGPGRWHVYLVASEPTRAEFGQLVDLMRQERRLEPRQLDVRRVIRPLGAPHRKTGPSVQPETLEAFEAAVARLPPATRSPRPARPREDSTAATATLDSRSQAMIDKAVGAATGDRSFDEFALTRDLVNHGISREASWAAVLRLGGKSAERGFHWWSQHIWAKVQAPPTPPHAATAVDLSQLILPTVAELRPQLLALDRRQQHTIETVCWVVLERLQERPGEYVPLSERDLELGTGLTRRTARQALQWLENAGVLVHRRGIRRDDAKEWILGPEARKALNAPPRLTPSARRWAPGCPPGTASHVLDAHLPPTLCRQEAGSSRQRQLTARRAAACSDRQLLDCVTPAEGALPSTADRHRNAAANRHDQEVWTRCLHRVTEERDEFYRRLRAARARRDETWHQARREAFVRDRARQRRWWRSLSETERERRRLTFRQRHRAGSAGTRAAACERLRRRRAIRCAVPALPRNGATPISVPDPGLAPERDSGLTCS